MYLTKQNELKFAIEMAADRKSDNEKQIIKYAIDLAKQLNDVAERASKAEGLEPSVAQSHLARSYRDAIESTFRWVEAYYRDAVADAEKISLLNKFV